MSVSIDHLLAWRMNPSFNRRQHMNNAKIVRRPTTTSPEKNVANKDAQAANKLENNSIIRTIQNVLGCLVNKNCASR